MDSISVNRFRDQLRAYVERVIEDHEALKVTRRDKADFVVISAEDWERDQETLYVLQNTALMRQIAASAQTHTEGVGYRPSVEEVNEITGI